MVHGTNFHSKPSVSIIVRTLFAKPDKLRVSLKSALLQTYRPFEIILCVDSGATVRIGEIKQWLLTNQLDSPFLKVFFSNLPSGRSFTANKALSVCNSDAICFLDDDDRLFENHLSSLMPTLFGNPNAIAAYANSICVGAQRSPFKPGSFSKIKLQQKNMFPIQSVLFRRSDDKRIYFNTSLKFLEDWDFWLRLSDLGKFLYVDDTTSEFFLPYSHFDIGVRWILHYPYFLKIKSNICYRALMNRLRN